jgi:type III secretion protein J
MIGHRARPLLAALLLLLLAACKVDLFTGLNERDANDMLAVLLRHGIDAEKSPGTEGTFALRVEQDKFAQAVELLKMQGFPREPFETLGEVFKKEGLISSPLEERVRLVYALSQELSATLSEIDGVLSARVHVVLPDNALSTGKIIPSSAAVFIRHTADAPVDQLVPQIKMLVTNSIEGLTYDKVSVVLFPVEMPPESVRGSKLVEIGPLRLDPSTTGSFWAILGGLGLLALVGLGGTGAMAYLWLKAKKGGAPPAGGAPALPAPAE